MTTKSELTLGFSGCHMLHVRSPAVVLTLIFVPCNAFLLFFKLNNEHSGETPSKKFKTFSPMKFTILPQVAASKKK